MTRQTAIDLEARNLTDPPQFTEPAGKWDVFAIGLSHKRDAETPPDTTVLVRRDGTERGLRKLLTAMANWLRERAPHGALVTYNGTSFDLPILEGHIERIEEHDPQLGAHVRNTLDITHRDLMKEIIDNQPASKRWPSLDKALSTRGIDSATAKLEGDEVTGALMPAIGSRVLDPEKTLGAHERSALKKYASSDVRPLHQLADTLDRDRVAEEEAEMVTMTGEKTTGGYND